jgi:glycosyltransferase involved in cell wall biosynthesis
MYPPHHLGGYELSCRDVMDRLRARGHEITVLTTTMRLSDVEESPGERAHGIRRDIRFYWEDHRLLSPPLRQRLTMERANRAALRAAVEASNPDVVSVWNMGAMSLGLLTTIVDRRLPIVFAVCDDWLVYGPRLDAWTRLFAGRKWLARVTRSFVGVPTAPPDLADAGAFCFVTDFVRRRAKEHAHLDPPNATVVYSGIDRVDFPPAVPDPRPWAGRLLYVGRIDDRKGLHIAFEALAKLPEDTTLEILGRGDAAYRVRLDELANRLGVARRVRFGVAPRTELRDHYRAADALLFPVLWDEPFGLVPIEAMSCGTPVVATGTGGSAEFLAHDRNCLLTGPGDPTALAGAIGRLAADPSLRARLVEGGLRLAEELTTDRLADTFEAWHSAAAERFSHGRPPDRPSPLSAVVSPDGSPEGGS